MAKSGIESKLKPRTLRELAAQVDDLRERVEDLEDLRDLREAVLRNAARPLVPRSQVKKGLELD